MAGTGLKKHAITENTPKNLLFNACVLYKNLKWAESAFTGEPLGASSGGTKFIYTPEYMGAEIDGATVQVKGMKYKVGETASIEISFTEFKEEIFKDALHLVEDTTKTIEGYKVYKTRADLTEEDFLENVALVGTLVSGKQVILVLENTLCTSAMELETKNKTQSVYTCTFECHASFEQDDLNHLPVYIYYPQESTVPGP